MTIVNWLHKCVRCMKNWGWGWFTMNQSQGVQGVYSITLIGK